MDQRHSHKSGNHCQHFIPISFTPCFHYLFYLPHYQRVLILLLSILTWVLVPHKMNWEQANRRVTLTIGRALQDPGDVFILRGSIWLLGCGKR